MSVDLQRAPGVVVSGLRKCFGPTVALASVDLTIPAGQFVSVMGPSGCGKSTLLSLIAGLETPSAGHVRVVGVDLSVLSDDERTELRLRHVGIIFQSFNLFPAFSVLENVGLPLDLLGLSRRTVRRRAVEMLERVEIGTLLHDRRPAELSGGEQQRVAIARALVIEPELLLADEPTGNLDARSARAILRLLVGLNEETGLTILMVTHDIESAMTGDRTVELRDGAVVRDVSASERQSASVIPLRTGSDWPRDGGRHRE
jgi:putative ABC transport system ATP-binding protein